MTQLELDTPRARRTDPATSHAAAASIDPLALTATQRAIVSLFRLYGPMTDENLRARWAGATFDHVSDSGLRTRRRELVDAGHLRDTGRRTTMSTGRSAIVWEAVA